MATKEKEKPMPAYGTAYGVRHYGSETPKTGAAPAPGTSSPAAPSADPVSPPPAIPPAAPQAPESDPMGDAIMRLMQSLQRSVSGGSQSSGNPYLDRIRNLSPDDPFYGRLALGAPSRNR